LNTQTKMQNEEGVITELYIPRKWYLVLLPFFVVLVLCLRICFVFGLWISNGFVNAVQRRTGWLLQRTMPPFRLTLGIWMRTVCTMAISPPLLSADLSVLRSLFSPMSQFDVVCMIEFILSEGPLELLWLFYHFECFLKSYYLLC
jgi:hypothetical protein